MATNTLFLSETANKELAEAAKWYEDQSEGLGARFLYIVKERLLLIELFPERYPKRHLNFRETILPIFPYSVVYTYYKKSREIHVSAIYHCSRNPKKKYRVSK